MIPRPHRSPLFPYTTLFRSYFVSQIQDITARKHAESQLVDSEFRYRTIANLVPGFVFEGVERSEEHTSELQSRRDLVCRLLLEKKKNIHDILKHCSCG